jgi:hypothetical protein
MCCKLTQASAHFHLYPKLFLFLFYFILSDEALLKIEQK